MSKRFARPIQMIISTVCLMLCCVCAFASDVSAIGYGDSIADAQANALHNLTSTIFGTNVFSGTLVTLDSQGDGSSFSQSVSTLSYGNLVSVQYSNAEKTSGGDKKLGTYKVCATIPDSAHDVYLIRLRDSMTSVRSIYAQNADGIDQRKAKLSNLLNALSEYNNSRQVLISMGYAASVPELGIPITFQSVYSEYESLLIEEENSLLKSSSSASTYAAQMELRFLLQQNEAEQKSLALQKENALAQANAMNLASINEQIQQAIEKVVQTTSKVSDNDFASSASAILQAIADYDAMCALYDGLLADEFERIDLEYEVNRTALENKAFKTAELKMDGTPTDSALAVRADEMQELVQQRDLQKTRVENLVSDSLRKGIQDRYDNCVKLLDDVQSKSFILDSRDDRTALVIGSYDGEDFYWNVSLQSEDFSIHDIHVGYELLTGQEPVIYSAGKKNRDEYYKYVNAQASYDAALKDGARLFDLIAQYHLVLDAKNDRYAYVIDGIRFVSASAEIVMDEKDYVYTNQWFDSPFAVSDHGYTWLVKNEVKSVSEVASSTSGRYTYPLIPYESSYDTIYGKKTVQYEDIATIPYAYTVGGGYSGFAGDWELGLRTDLGFGFVLDETDDVMDIFDVEASAALDFVYYTTRFTYLGISPAVSLRLSDGERSTTFHVAVDAGLYLEDVASLGVRFGIGRTFFASAYMRIMLPFMQKHGFVPELGIEYENSPNSVRAYFGAVFGF